MQLDHQDYQIYSFDASLAFLGGYAALLWQIASLILSGWQDFAYSNTLTTELYSNSKYKTEGSDTEDDLTKTEQAVLNRQPHEYYPKTDFLANLSRYLLCCCRRRDWHKNLVERQRQNNAIQEDLKEQMDVV